ncbi:MAG TPA: sodium ABC transporter permease [Xanthomonadales bacterium]|nr:sodium ABC transporter permease [Xanthomonadales bacterium]
MNTMTTVWTVMLKELIDLFRDRRTVMLSLLMGPLLMPALLLGVGTLAEKRLTTQMEKPLELPVVGAEHAPNLIAWLATRNVDVLPAPDDPEARIIAQENDLILLIGADYPEAWRAGRSARVEVLLDSSRQDTGVVRSRLYSLLEAYSREVGALRLVARGIDPGTATAVRIADRDLATPEARTGQIVGGMLSYLLILFAFLGGAYLVIDVTAGERERQSLEPLLATPAARGAIMSGKIAAACAFGLIGLALILIAFKLSFDYGPNVRIKTDVSPSAILSLLVTLLPMVLIGTTLLTLISASVKSVKEAQSYMSVLMLLPIIPTVALLVSPVKNQLWMFAVPFLAQNQMIMRIARGEGVTAQEWSLYLACGLGLGALLWLIAARLYHREKLAISS